MFPPVVAMAMVQKLALTVVFIRQKTKSNLWGSHWPFVVAHGKGRGSSVWISSIQSIVAIWIVQPFYPEAWTLLSRVFKKIYNKKTPFFFALFPLVQCKHSILPQSSVTRKTPVVWCVQWVNGREDHSVTLKSWSAGKWWELSWLICKQSRNKVKPLHTLSRIQTRGIFQPHLILMQVLFYFFIINISPHSF